MSNKVEASGSSPPQEAPNLDNLPTLDSLKDCLSEIEEGSGGQVLCEVHQKSECAPIPLKEDQQKILRAIVSDRIKNLQDPDADHGYSKNMNKPTGFELKLIDYKRNMHQLNPDQASKLAKYFLQSRIKLLSQEKCRISITNAAFYTELLNQFHDVLAVELCLLNTLTRLPAFKHYELQYFKLF